MSADFRFILHAAERHADELASHRVCNGFPERGLAHSWRSGKAENRRLLVFFELEDGEEFEDPLFHILEPVMVLVENAFRFGDVEAVLRIRLPRQRENPVDIVVCDRVFACRRRNHCEAFELFFDRLGDAFRRFEFGQPLFKCGDVGILGILAEFLLDGSELFA